MKELPERHIECSECKKPIKVIYTEIVGKMIYRLSMCSSCPILKQKMYGSQPVQTFTEALAAGLCCGNCKTSQDEVKMGAPLGCSLCYEVFDEILTQDLVHAERMTLKQKLAKRPTPLHLGRQPGEKGEVTPAAQLISLHQALHDTLSREEYEQAAWLRDQIKELTEETKKDEQEPTT